MLTRMSRSVFGRVALVTGSEGLLADRAVGETLAAAREVHPDVEVSEIDAARLDGASLAEMTGGSLFATWQVALVRDLASLSDDLHDTVLALAIDPVPEAAVILVHGGGNKGKGLLDKLRKSPGVDVTDCPPPRAWEIPQFVSAEVRRIGGRIDPPTAQFLVDAVGHDLRSLVAAVSQLRADSEGSSDIPVIDRALIKKYFGGRAEVTSFAVADAALAGRTDDAMEQLRWALSTGVPPVLVTSALASGLRGLGKLIDAPAGLRENDLARAVGVPPWKLKSMHGQARGWDASGLAGAIRVVAQADADVKGAAVDPAYALERAVLKVTQSRGARRQRT